MKPPTMAPVVHADVKLICSPPRKWVDIRFKSTKEIDSLIDALRRLRDTKSGEFDLVHLHDHHLCSHSTAIEINLHRPRKKRDRYDNEYVRESSKLLRKMKIGGTSSK